jgi:NAD(P)H-flavin reductase
VADAGARPEETVRLTLPIRDVVRVTPRTVLLRLSLGSHAFPFAAGQAVLAGLPGQPARKPYALALAPSLAADLGILELLVQVDASSPEPHLEDLTSGDLLEVEGPFGARTWPTETTALLLVAGGTGIAPLRSILWEALLATTPPRITLVYSARSEEEFAFVEELSALAGAGRIDLHLTVTRPAAGGGTWRRGRVDQGLLAEALPSPDASCYVCGPEPFVHDVSQALETIGVPPSRIAREV